MQGITNFIKNQYKLSIRLTFNDSVTTVDFKPGFRHTLYIYRLSSLISVLFAF